MFPKVGKALLDAAPVAAFVGNRVYRHGWAPQNVAAPYVTWSVSGGAPDNSFGGACADFQSVQVDCWSLSDLQVENLAKEVRNTLETYCHCTGYAANERDFETQKYRISMVFEWILSR